MAAGETGASQTSLIRSGLRAAPASARGWTLLAKAQSSANPVMAAAALSQAQLIAPNEFWLMGPRARVAASLWPHLDATTQEKAKAQVRLLWQDWRLHAELLKLLGTPDGVRLVSQAFRGHRDELRAMNRWVAATNRNVASQP
jgi:hypothetical protein